MKIYIYTHIYSLVFLQTSYSSKKLDCKNSLKHHGDAFFWKHLLIPKRLTFRWTLESSWWQTLRWLTTMPLASCPSVCSTLLCIGYLMQSTFTIETKCVALIFSYIFFHALTQDNVCGCKHLLCKATLRHTSHKYSNEHVDVGWLLPIEILRIFKGHLESVK